MNTREDHLRHELRAIENTRGSIQALLSQKAWNLSERAHLQAQLDVLGRRRNAIKHLLSCA